MSRFVKDLFYTGCVSIATIICLLLSTRILALNLGQFEFGILAVIRRIITLAEPLCTIGLALTLTKEIATTECERLRRKKTLCSVFLILAANVFIFITTSIFVYFYNDTWVFKIYFYPTLALTFTYSLFVLTYSYFRGAGNIATANMIQLFSIAIGPLLLAYFFASNGNLDFYLYASSLLFLFSFLTLRKKLIVSLSLNESIKIIKAMLQHSIPRIFGVFLFGLLLGFGTIVSPYSTSIELAGFLSIGLSFWKVVEGVTESFSRVAYPILSKVVDLNGKEYISSHINNLVEFLIHFGIFTTVHLVLWTDVLINLWFGSKYGSAYTVVLILNLGILPYLFYVTVRPIIEVISVRAVNTYIIIIAIIVMMITYLATFFGGFKEYSPIISTLLGVYALGILAFSTIKIKWKLINQKLHILPVLLIMSLQTLIILYLKDRYIIGLTDGYLIMVNFIAFELVSFIAYLVLLNYYKVSWVKILKEYLMKYKLELRKKL